MSAWNANYWELCSPAHDPRESSAVTHTTQIKWRRIESAAQLGRISDRKLNHRHQEGPFIQSLCAMPLFSSRPPPPDPFSSSRRRPHGGRNILIAANSVKRRTLVMRALILFYFHAPLLPRICRKLKGRAARIIAFQSGLKLRMGQLLRTLIRRDKRVLRYFTKCVLDWNNYLL